MGIDTQGRIRSNWMRPNEAPRSSLLRRSSRFGCEGWKLRGILRNSPTRRPEPLGGVPKPLPSFAKATEGSPRLHPRSKLRGIRRRRINHTLEEGLHVVLRHRGSAESRRRGLKFGIRDAGYEFRDSRSGIRDPGFKARISYPETRIPSPASSLHQFDFAWTPGLVKPRFERAVVATGSRLHVVAGAISRSMRFAFSISATRRSYAACKFSHERASPPK